jgi:acyl carrier protein
MSTKEPLSLLEALSEESRVPVESFEESRPLAELGIDSMTMIAALVRIEGEQDLEFVSADLELTAESTAEDLAALIERARARASGGARASGA